MALSQLTSSDAGESARRKINAAIAAVDTISQQLRDGLTQAENARAQGDSALADSIVSTVSAEAQRRIDAVASALAQALAAVTAEGDARSQADGVLARGLTAEATDRAAGDASLLAQILAGDEASLDAVDELRAEVIEGVVARFRSGRPGDNPIGFTIGGTAGVASNLPALPARYIADSDLGLVARFSEPVVLAARDTFPIEPGQVFKIALAVRRYADSPDPSNEGVRFGAVWTDRSKLPLANDKRFSKVGDLLNLKVADGQVTLSATVGQGVEADIVPPYGARYGRIICQVFGSSHTTDVILLDAVDISNAQVLSGAAAGLDGRLTGIETQNLGGRLAVAEAAIGTPSTQTFKTLQAARSATIDPSIDAINLLGIATPADGRGRLFKRFVGGAAPTTGTYFQTKDGAYWLSIAQWLLGDDLNLPLIGPAVHAVGVSAAPGAVPYTDQDRFGDHFVDFHTLISAQATTGFQAEQDALAAGLIKLRDAYAVTGRPNVGVFARNWDFIAESGQPGEFDANGKPRAIRFPVEIRARHKSIVLVPRATMRALFFFGGLSGQSMHTFTATNPIDASQVLDFTLPEQPVQGGASAIMRVEKPPGTEQFIAGNFYVRGFPMMIDWRDGTNFLFHDVDGTTNGLIAYIRNSGMDSHGRNLVNRFGGGLRVTRDTTRTGAGPAVAGVQGMEGTTFVLVKALQTVAPAFGYKEAPIKFIDSGLKCSLLQCQPQELVYGPALEMLALNVSITNMVLEDFFMNTNSDGRAANPSLMFNAINLVGSVQWPRIRGGHILDYPGFAIALNGNSATDTVFEHSIRDVTCERNGKGDFYANFASGTVDGNSFLSPTGIFEQDSAQHDGRNYFAASPRRLSKYSNWSGGRGPGAPIGLPKAAQIVGDPAFVRGRDYYLGDNQPQVLINGA